MAKPDMCCVHGEWSRKIFGVCFVVVMLALACWIGLKARNAAREYAFIGIPVERNTISVSGEGKVTAIPDIAAVDMGTSVERVSVSDAQAENTRVMNVFIADLAKNGVDAKDIQTSNYSISPAYDYLNGRTKLRGYVVAQSVHVKVRKLDNLGAILDAAGTDGLNQVGGIAFSVDQPDQLKDQARIKAFQDAQARAATLAKVMGVTLRRVVSFSESGNAPVPQPKYFSADAVGLGGASASPTVEAGSTDFVDDATVTYEIE